MRSIDSVGYLLITGFGVATLATSGQVRAQSRQQPHDGVPHGAVRHEQTPAPSRDSTITTLLTGPLGSRSLSGTATLSGTTIRVTLSGDRPGATRPWHIHRGPCNRDEGVVAATGAYQSIVVDSRGEGSATATLVAPLTPGVRHVVEVHDTTAGTALGVIACGTLTEAEQGRDTSATDMSKMESMGHGATRPDSVSSLLVAVYNRMMADPVIRERAATDPVLRRLVAQLATMRGATAPPLPDDDTSMPGMTMPPAPTTKGASSETTNRRTSVKSKSAKPAQKPATKAAPKPAPRPPKDSMPPGMKMPGMSGGSMSNMSGLSKP